MNHYANAIERQVSISRGAESAITRRKVRALRIRSPTILVKSRIAVATSETMHVALDGRNAVDPCRDRGKGKGKEKQARRAGSPTREIARVNTRPSYYHQ